MTMHFYTFSDARSGTSRQRAFRIAEGLHTHGFKTVIHTPPVLAISNTPWPKKFVLIMQTIRSLFSIKKGDIIFLQRTISNKYFFVIMVVYLFIFRRKMIFDFDDPVWTHSYFKTKTLTQIADAVITCTHGQAIWARQFNSNVHILHIVVDFPAYEKFTKNYEYTQSPLIIGWVGTGPEHVRNLEILVPVLAKLVTTTTVPFKFVLIGALKNKKVYDLFQNVLGLNIEFIDSLNWTDPESVPREIQKFDIGVVPHQSEGEWNKGKTSMKILEYMACSVPAVVSAFGEMPYIIQDDVNGYIASTDEQWVEKLEKLLSEKELRVRFGHAGQDLVRTEYCFAAVIPKYVEIIRTLQRHVD